MVAPASSFSWQTNQSPTPLTISSEINAATRQIHTQLNRLITSRIPLALPPYADSPRIYTQGLRHFAHIYLTFESLWRDITAPKPINASLSSLLEDPWIPVHHGPGDTSHTATRPLETDSKVPELLAHLLPPGLMRSHRLRRDLAFLSGLSAVDLDVQLSHFPSLQVRKYTAHLREVVAQKPHVLIAYAWVMYMAIFSGGRWIRAQLLTAGEEFWAASKAGKELGKRVRKQSTQNLDEIGLSFFHFSGNQDGEDTKAEFKRRLLSAEGLLSLEQRQDIIEEAKEIFKWSILLVEELDELLATPLEPISIARDAGKSTAKDTVVVEQPAVPSVQPWYQLPGLAGVAVVLSCVSWYAVYHA